MLLNEFLKEHKTVQELKAKVQKQEVIIAQQQRLSVQARATAKANRSSRFGSSESERSV